MSIPLSVSLIISCVAVCFSINTKEEIVKVATASVAIIGLFLSLFFAPWFVKLIILAVPLFWDKLQLLTLRQR